MATQRKMVIQRVRNPQDESNYVDVAMTTAMVVSRGSGANFQRTVWRFDSMQLGDPADQSEEFLVESRSDLEAAAAAFAAQNPD